MSSLQSISRPGAWMPPIDPLLLLLFLMVVVKEKDDEDDDEPVLPLPAGGK